MKIAKNLNSYDSSVLSMVFNPLHIYAYRCGQKTIAWNKLATPGSLD